MQTKLSASQVEILLRSYMQDLRRSSKNLTISLIRYKISHYKNFDILKISKDLINFSIRLFLVRWIILGILVRSCRISCKILNKILLGDLSKTLAIWKLMLWCCKKDVKRRLFCLSLTYQIL